MAMTRLTGMSAIRWAKEYGLSLNKFTDPSEGAREDLTVEEARAVATEDPSLIWIDVEDCTDDQLQLLRASASEVGDLETVALCDIALTGEIDERVDLTDEERARILDRFSDEDVARAECARMVNIAEAQIDEIEQRLRSN